MDFSVHGRAFISGPPAGVGEGRPARFVLDSNSACNRNGCAVVLWCVKQTPLLLTSVRSVSEGVGAESENQETTRRVRVEVVVVMRLNGAGQRVAAAASRGNAGLLAGAGQRLAAAASRGHAAAVAGLADAAMHREQYAKDGFTIKRNVIDRELVAEMSAHVDRLTRKFPDVPGEHMHHLIMRNDPFWVRLCADPRLVDLAVAMAPDFLGDGNVALFSSHYFVKQPRTGMKVLWHQDGSYWPLRPMNVVTLWVAVDPSNASNGCLRVVKGTHTVDLATLKQDRSVKNVLGSATHSDGDIASLGWGSRIVDLELEPGDVSIHHPGIVHGSEANTSDTRRCGLTIRYISTGTQCFDPEQPVMLMRGRAQAGVNEYRSWPKYRPGYDMPFAGAEEWNATRYVNPADEAYFARTDYTAMDAEIEGGLYAFIDQLGGR